MIENTYLEDATFYALVDALSAPPAEYTGHPVQDAVKLLLGEIGGIWPANIKGDADDS